MDTEKNRAMQNKSEKQDRNTFQACLLYVIQDALYERKLQQKKLAEAWNVDQSTVSRIFSGASPLTITKVEQAARLFGVDTYVLLHKTHRRQLTDAKKAKLRDQRLQDILRKPRREPPSAL